MGIELGPVLRLRGCDLETGAWTVSALVVTKAGDPQPEVTAKIGATALPVAAAKLATDTDLDFWRFDMPVALKPDLEQAVDYSVGGTAWRFQVPRRDAQPKFAYVSCNGFSSLKLMKSVADKNALWKNIAELHGKNAYHALLMGGDQVYADAMWDMVPALRSWNQLPWPDDAAGKKEKERKLPAGLDAQLRKHFFKTMYCERWSQPEVKAMLASIPTVMMWDDHDIMDGWGSYPDNQLDCEVYKLIFAVAGRCFELFQLQNCMGDPVFIPGVGMGYSQLYDFGSLALLIPDLRSERRLDRVLSRESWDAIYAAIGRIRGPMPAEHKGQCRQLMVMSSIPVMHARFSQVETILSWVPGQQELEDDLHDHWSSRPHKAERLRLIHRLLQFSEEQGARVTILSGDVHVAATASIVSDRDLATGNENALVQLTSSAVVHPAPPAIMRFALNHLLAEDEEIDRGITGHMEKMPGDERRYIAARNWLSLEPDDVDNPQFRIWANWYIEGELEHPFTRVIHPV